MTTSRSTARAGQLQAGDTIADGALPDLLAFDSVTAGVKVGDLLRERAAATAAAIARHAATATAAQLTGDAAELAHAAEAARLDREAARLGVAIEHADARLADVAAAERKAAARAKIDAARADAERAEAIVATLYPAAAHAVAELLRELSERQARVRAARADAADAGLPDAETADLQLPHERRSCSALTEMREVEEVEARPSVTDAHGNPVNGASGRRWGGRQDQPAPNVVRRTERVTVRPRFDAPDLTRARALLPDPEGGWSLDRGEDN